MRVREALAAIVLIAICVPVWEDATRIVPARASGYFAIEGVAPDNWNEMQKLFDFIHTNASPGSVLLANLDGAFFLNTGRKAVRGFAPAAFDLYYATPHAIVTPDQLSRAIVREGATYVALTPDRGLPESESFRRSVAALERGGVVEPLSVPGAPPDYRLFKVTR